MLNHRCLRIRNEREMSCETFNFHNVTVLRETDGAMVLLVNISFHCSRSIGFCQQKRNVVSKVAVMKASMKIYISSNTSYFTFVKGNPLY